MPRWEGDIRMDPTESGVNMKNCVDSTQSSNYWRLLANAALNVRQDVNQY